MLPRVGSLSAPLLSILVALAGASPADALDPWPAEPYESAVNLTSIEGPGTNDFYVDLSGAAWNPLTRTLWVCRNGPGTSGSKLWAVVEDGNGSFTIDSLDGRRGEWTGFGDFEGVTQADFDENVVYAIIEGEERIKEYDVSTYGTAVLRNDWDTSPYLPLSGGAGAEGITFVPDSFLAASGFVDADGVPRMSSGGMGGLMFVGHQNGGALYVFDLDRVTGGFVFVGAYATGYTEVAALEFDRSAGELYAWHDASFDVLSVFDLRSEEVPGEEYRNMTPVRRFAGPSSANNEGIAIVSCPDCVNGKRSFFMTVDGGGSASLLWYREFEDGCFPWTFVPPEEDPDRAEISGAGPRVLACPNPFRGATVLSCLLPLSADFTLRIYDPAGRIVRTLGGGWRPAGVLETVWDGRDDRGERVSAGVYLCAPQAGDAARATKLLLMR